MDPEALRRTMRARMPRATGRWYEIKNATADLATVRIYEEIGFWGITAEDFAADLQTITAPQIEVQINSPGGEVWDGIAIYNALRTHPATVTTRVDGMAASAASVIVQAGDRRVMVSGSQMMIHEAWGLAIGNADDMRQMADILDIQSNVIAGIYAERAGGDVEHFRGLMRDETWLVDQGAVDAGLADEVFSPPRKDSAQDRAPSPFNADKFFERLESFAARIEKSGDEPASDPIPSGPEPNTSEAEAFLRAVLANTKENTP